jgi:hypothetical protein
LLVEVLVVAAAKVSVVPPALAMMVIPVTVVVAAIGLRADRRARGCANHGSDRRATSAADCRAYAGADTGAHKRAANRILRTGTGRHNRQRCKGSDSNDGLSHGILQPLNLFSNATASIKFLS